MHNNYKNDETALKRLIGRNFKLINNNKNQVKHIIHYKKFNTIDLSRQ